MFRPRLQFLLRVGTSCGVALWMKSLDSATTAPASQMILASFGKKPTGLKWRLTPLLIRSGKFVDPVLKLCDRVKAVKSSTPLLAVCIEEAIPGLWRPGTLHDSRVPRVSRSKRAC